MRKDLKYFVQNDHKKNREIRYLERFLQKNIGKPWNELYSKLCNVAGPSSRLIRRRIDFMLEWKITSNTSAIILAHRSNTYYVDKNGLLQKTPAKKKKKKTDEIIETSKKKSKPSYYRPVNQFKNTDYQDFHEKTSKDKRLFSRNTRGRQHYNR